MKLLIVGLAGAVLLTACSQSPAPGETDSAARIDAVITRANVERLERGLAHDSMEGRRVGTPGAVRAARFIAEEMKSIGLEPAGDNGTYFQSVTGTAVPVYTAGSLLVNGGQPLTWNVDFTAAPSLTAPPVLSNIPVIYGGISGDTAATISAEQAAGRIVVLSVPAAGAGRAGGGRGAGAPTAKFARAAAIVTVNLDGVTREAIARLSMPTQAVSPRSVATAAPVALRMTSDGAAKLFGAPLAGLRPGTTASGTATLRLTHRLTPQPEWTRNVIGIIRGSDPKLKDEWVIIDAHYDHLGIGTPTNGDSIFNGADDDASGTVAMLEIARALRSGPPPKRSVIFAAMTGEEGGLIGTRFYIAHPTVPLTSMIGNLEIEMIGRPDSLAGGPGKAWLTGYERSTMGEMLAAQGIPIVQDPRPSQNFFQRSDNYAFATAGIPAHTLSTFNLHTDYHRVSDDADKIDFDHMTAVTRAGARAARLLVDGPKPEWKPGGRPGAPVN